MSRPGVPRRRCVAGRSGLVAGLAALVSSALGCATGDPSPGLFVTKATSRRFECLRLEPAAAHALRPDRFPEPFARMPDLSPEAVQCLPTMLAPGERGRREDALLRELTASVQDLAQRAVTAAPGRSWLVEAFDPDLELGAKLAAAGRVELARRRHVVSERVPLLAPADVSVISSRPWREAFPLACARYAAEGSLDAQDALLALVTLDARETQLHGGLCADGLWRWLR